jgi:FkbM family methyltransferase
MCNVKMVSLLIAAVCAMLPFKGMAQEETIDGLQTAVTPQFLKSVCAPYFDQEPYLEEYIQSFPFENYKVYQVERDSIFYVDGINDTIKNVVRTGSLWERHIIAKIPDLVWEGSVAVDVGGHIGTHALIHSRAVGEHGTVHVFEPQNKLFPELLINMALNGRNNIIFHHEALGKDDSWVELCVLNPNDEGGRYIGSGGERVKMSRLDDLHLQNVSLIEIDVEGYEMNVLAGARETIARCKPALVIEIWPHAQQQQKILEIRDLGYREVYIDSSNLLFLPI